MPSLPSVRSGANREATGDQVGSISGEPAMRKRKRPPIEELIGRWRVRADTPWDAIVGHSAAIARLQELAAKVTLDPAERRRLGLRLGAGVVIAGRAGVGKSLLARALVSSLGRDAILPVTAELDAELLTELYGALDGGAPTAIILDEAEAMIGDPDWHTTDQAAQRALLAALDGVAERPDEGPITIALTTADAAHLSSAATRPGRLAPRLELDLPSADERREILRRAIDGLPGAEGLDLERIAERTQAWSGAELVALPEQAITRSLCLPAPPGLRDELVLQVVGERYVVRDPLAAERRDPEAISRHEAGHALWARLTWGPGAVAAVRVSDRDGATTLVEAVAVRRRGRAELRLLAGLRLAGAAAEHLLWGADGVTQGAERDRREATDHLLAAYELALPLDQDVLEGIGYPRGAQAMRRDRYDAVRADAAHLWDEVVEDLRPHSAAIIRLGDALLAAPDMTLSGELLDAAIEAALQSAGAGTTGRAGRRAADQASDATRRTTARGTPSALDGSAPA